MQQVIPQETIAGHAPPLPKVDPTQPVISVVLVRDLGQARLLPAVMFIISFVAVHLLRGAAALPRQDAAQEPGRRRGRPRPRADSREGLTRWPSTCRSSLLLVLAIVFGLLSRVASRLLGPRNLTLAKMAPYECGIVPDQRAARSASR